MLSNRVYPRLDDAPGAGSDEATSWASGHGRGGFEPASHVGAPAPAARGIRGNRYPLLRPGSCDGATRDRSRAPP